MKEIVIDDVKGVVVNDLKRVQERPVMVWLKGIVIDEVSEDVTCDGRSSTRSEGVLIDALSEVYNRMRV